MGGDAASNWLYYGDNLTVLREKVATNSVDLVYLDPPFNSNRAYNVIFDRDGAVKADDSTAQIQAFTDTWHWTPLTEQQYQLSVSGGLPEQVTDALLAFRTLLGENDAMAYLVNMAPRLVELHRILKRAGSLYLHCDPTMSHYLKIMLDAIFGAENFVNEVIWKRSTAHSDAKQGARHMGRLHDTILFYGRSAAHEFNTELLSYDPQYLASKYRYVEEGTGRRYRLDNLTGPGGAAKGNPAYEVMGVTRYWRYSRERMDELIKAGRIVQTRPGTVPQYKRYLDEMPGVSLQDVWTDIDPINSRALERLGYQTQKPVALLERIIKMSSGDGATVLDPFCGCGTTIDAAQRLARHWIGIDVAFIAIDLIRHRLRGSFPGIEGSYKTHGIPSDLGAARDLFHQSPFDFERWAVSLMQGRPNEKQRGDKGVDGVARFYLGKTQRGRVLISVKGGDHVGPQFVRDLLGTVATQKAEMGVLILLAEPTRGILDAVDHGGTYRWTITGQTYPRVQVITVKELLAGKKPEMPTPLEPYPQAFRAPADSGQLAFEDLAESAG
jgi:DNA modification methylase